MNATLRCFAGLPLAVLAVLLGGHCWKSEHVGRDRLAD
jgi:hypothetical protein